ncbi:unnamed protein product [Prorocentrum cordatum]|uniref:Uncharacterized protein n=1 Tax=Prorocentrum cordatum TaxID=2364126 RepID=A0ABN9U6V5_9DINO|nr:unnamed protein product [Polarella glacialis]
MSRRQELGALVSAGLAAPLPALRAAALALVAELVSNVDDSGGDGGLSLGPCRRRRAAPALRPARREARLGREHAREQPGSRGGGSTGAHAGGRGHSSRGSSSRSSSSSSSSSGSGSGSGSAGGNARGSGRGVRQPRPQPPYTPLRLGSLKGPGAVTRVWCVALSAVDEHLWRAGAPPAGGEGVLDQVRRGPCSWSMLLSCTFCFRARRRPPGPLRGVAGRAGRVGARGRLSDEPAVRRPVRALGRVRARARLRVDGRRRRAGRRDGQVPDPAGACRKRRVLRGSLEYPHALGRSGHLRLPGGAFDVVLCLVEAPEPGAARPLLGRIPGRLGRRRQGPAASRRVPQRSPVRERCLALRGVVPRLHVVAPAVALASLRPPARKLPVQAGHVIITPPRRQRHGSSPNVSPACLCRLSLVVASLFTN